MRIEAGVVVLMLSMLGFWVFPPTIPHPTWAILLLILICGLMAGFLLTIAYVYGYLRIRYGNGVKRDDFGDPWIPRHLDYVRRAIQIREALFSHPQKQSREEWDTANVCLAHVTRVNTLLLNRTEFLDWRMRPTPAAQPLIESMEGAIREMREQLNRLDNKLINKEG